MADKDFTVSLKALIDSYRKNETSGYRFHVVNELRTLAEFIEKGDPWPAEITAQEAAIKNGQGSISEPTEAEMKNAAAKEEAASLARLRGLGDDYTSEAEPDVPQAAIDERMERQFKEFRGEEGIAESVPGRPIPAPTVDRRDPDATKPATKK